MFKEKCYINAGEPTFVLTYFNHFDNKKIAVANKQYLHTRPGFSIGSLSFYISERV